MFLESERNGFKMEWIEVAIKVTRDIQEAASNVLFETGINGLVIEDSKDILDCRQQIDYWDYFDEDSVKHAGEYVLIKAYLINDISLHDQLNLIEDRLGYIKKAFFPKASFEIDIKKVYQKDWENNWKKFYKTFNVGNNFIVKPTWDQKSYSREKNKIVIEMDPGMAFGTGTHETSSMCLELLEKYVKNGYTLIDVGCGSGILSIAAAKLGCEKVIALDTDDNAIKACKENVARNCVSNIVEVGKANLLYNVDVKANIVVANIIADCIIELCGIAYKNLIPGGLFVSSGIIKERYQDVVDELNMFGYDEVEVLTKGEWITIVAKHEEH